MKSKMSEILRRKVSFKNPFSPSAFLRYFSVKLAAILSFLPFNSISSSMLVKTKNQS